jgi:hypothetical protein
MKTYTQHHRTNGKCSPRGSLAAAQLPFCPFALCSCDHHLLALRLSCTALCRAGRGLGRTHQNAEGSGRLLEHSAHAAATRVPLQVHHGRPLEL